MENIAYKFDEIVDKISLYDLYEDVGWTEYIKDIEVLERGVRNSLDLITAWDGYRLIGLIRTVGDGETIVYIQDLLVMEEYQGLGIGSKLLNLIFDRHKKVRQKVLMTDNEDRNIKFYSKNGMRDLASLNAVAFMYLD